MADWSGSGSFGSLKRIVQIASSTPLANSSAETTMISTLIGNMIIPANTLVSGTNMYISAVGVFGTSLTTAAKFTINFKIGSTVLIACQTLNNLVASLTNKGWEFSGTVTCRAAGSSGALYSQGKLSHVDTIATVSSLQGVTSGNTATAAVDTTIANTLDMTAQWSAADAANTITMTNMTVELR